MQQKSNQNIRRLITKSKTVLFLFANKWSGLGKTVWLPCRRAFKMKVRLSASSQSYKGWVNTPWNSERVHDGKQFVQWHAIKASLVTLSIQESHLKKNWRNKSLEAKHEGCIPAWPIYHEWTPTSQNNDSKPWNNHSIFDQISWFEFKILCMIIGWTSRCCCCCCC